MGELAKNARPIILSLSHSSPRPLHRGTVQHERCSSPAVGTDLTESIEYHQGMLPAFDDYGNLPPGIHFCSPEDLAARFGTGSEERIAAIGELLEFIQAAKLAGVRRLLVNGSFVTGKLCPNDVDVVVLPGTDYPNGQQYLDADEMIWPFVQIIVAADDADFEAWALHQFGTDRERRAIGVVEVLL